MTWIGITPVLVTCEPKIVEDILMSPHCTDRSSVVDKAISSCVGPGLLTLRGKWKNYKIILNFPIFNILYRSSLARTTKTVEPIIQN